MVIIFQRLAASLTEFAPSGVNELNTSLYCSTAILRAPQGIFIFYHLLTIICSQVSIKELCLLQVALKQFNTMTFK